MAWGSYLKVEAEDGVRPILPDFAGVCAFVVQNVRQASVVCIKGILLLIEIPGAPTSPIGVP